MKIAIITDTHFGAKADTQYMLDYYEDFYSKVFFQYLDDHEIKHVLHLGDVFDRRKFVNFNTLDRTRKMFFDRLQQRDHISFDCLVGNHDTYYNNTLEINSPKLLLKDYFAKDNWRLIERPVPLVYDNRPCLILPWIVQENKEESFRLINQMNQEVVFGHLEINGFEFNRGNYCYDGMDRGVFKNYQKVMSGHFHQKSTQNHISYLGSPYEMTWIDYNEARGFHVFDTDTLELEFIRNPYCMHLAYYYNDVSNEHVTKLLQQMQSDNIGGRVVKLFVNRRADPATFDALFAKIEEMRPFSIDVVETELNLEKTDQANIGSVDDTLTVIKKYINVVSSTNNDVDENDLIELFTELYTKAELDEQT